MYTLLPTWFPFPAATDPLPQEAQNHWKKKGLAAVPDELETATM